MMSPQESTPRQQPAAAAKAAEAEAGGGSWAEGQEKGVIVIAPDLAPEPEDVTFEAATAE